MSSPTENISLTLITVLTPHVEFVFLMGSAETARFHKDSDVDVAVFWKNETTEKQMSLSKRTLEEKFNREVQLVTLNKIDVIFARQVLETGRLLINNSAGILLNWKMQKLSDYPDFKSTRKIIEDNILNRKKYV